MQVQEEQLSEEVLRMFLDGYDLHTWSVLVLRLQKQHLKVNNACIIFRLL